jgi:hypothetical protein
MDKYFRKERILKPVTNRQKQIDLFYLYGRPIFSTKYDDILTYIQKKKLIKKKNRNPPMKF